ncbi:PDZ and LIM domain protein 5-like isoform X1 [Athalia rosae]|uniref:PDZ and LIM domain protein 5-like isoform X1 n=2 Tax=Athalia rosae TaxID=37344 RepID=UPI0020346471|nr:PDZ and LIM domain protein 5-like isoform X1 [Athalia rosae]
MNFSEVTIRSLSNLQNPKIINDIIFGNILDIAILHLCERSDEKYAAQFYGSKPDVVREVFGNMLSVLIDAARLDLDGEKLSFVLSSANITGPRVQKLCDIYSNHKKTIQISLKQIGNSLPHIIDINWRLDFCVKTNIENSVASQLYTIQFSMIDRGELIPMKFTCTTQQLQELNLKKMSNMNQLEQQVNSLQINHEGEVRKTVKKIGPTVPPKPKKAQPEIPQSYSLKTVPAPSYSTVLNNIATNESKSTNLYTNSPTPYIPQTTSAEKHDVAHNTPTNGNSLRKLCNNEENLCTNQMQEKLQPKYGYIEKNFYSNIGSMSAPQPPVDDRAIKTNRDAVYENSEAALASSIQKTAKKEKDLIYSNIQWNAKPENMYSNISGAYTQDDLPPPPEPSEYVPCIPSNSFPPPPEELPPPPSPVSSSYSELRRATYQTEYPSENYPNDIYGPSSQSSTYESIYEPINPRPPSQLSCNYSMYSGYGSTPPTQIQGKMSPVKEVDALTNLLVQGMEDGADDVDIYGICSQCGRKVEGEGNGCSAMDKVFHITCFCCFVCHINLQGKPFYSLEGKPYCEEDYLNTLEKCCVCTRPILDRILRATGKPYHPSCFTCVVCGESLDGIPFTVDATNQIHCIQCFHKKFAPRCCVCKLPIMPEADQDETVRVVALDRSFHIHCYKCEDCGLILSSENEGRGCYPLDNHILCKGCNAARVQVLTSHMTTEL